MLTTFRFLLTWILTAIVMYIAFYMWHGVFLNDLSRISFSKPLFLVLAALVYLVISLVLCLLYESNILKNHIVHPILRGITCGFFIGFILFSFVTVLGISFTKDVNYLHIAVDFVWQVIEQIIGGLLIGLIKIIVFDPMFEPEMIRKD